MMRTLTILGLITAAAAGADVMTLHWGDPALPASEEQGVLYWANNPLPPAVPAVGALPIKDSGPNDGANILENGDIPNNPWQVSVNLLDEDGRLNGGIGYIVLSWDGKTPVVVNQRADWTLEATWELDAGVQQQYTVKDAKADLPVGDMLSKSNSYLYIGTDFLKRINRANFRIGTEWPNQYDDGSGSMELLGAWVVRNNNGSFSAPSYQPDGQTCINIGSDFTKIHVRIVYTASDPSADNTATIRQYFGMDDEEPALVLKHKYQASPPAAVVPMKPINDFYQADSENDSFNIKVRGYATRALGPIILTGDVVSGVNGMSEGEGSAEGTMEGTTEGTAEGSIDGSADGEGSIDGEGAPEGEGILDCDDELTARPEFDKQGLQLYNQTFGTLGYDWALTDNDGNGIIDSWEVAVFREVLFNKWYPLHQISVCTYLANRTTFLAEEGLAATYHPYADIIAALLSLSVGMQQTLANGMSLTGHYYIVPGSGLVGRAPFSANGNPDGDALKNIIEYAHIRALELPREKYVIVALDPRLDGMQDPDIAMPLIGVGVFCTLMGALGAFRARRNRS